MFFFCFIRLILKNRYLTAWVSLGSANLCSRAVRAVAPLYPEMLAQFPPRSRSYSRWPRSEFAVVDRDLIHRHDLQVGRVVRGVPCGDSRALHPRGLPRGHGC